MIWLSRSLASFRNHVSAGNAVGASPSPERQRRWEVTLDLALGGVGEFPASTLKIPSDLTLRTSRQRRIVTRRPRKRGPDVAYCAASSDANDDQPSAPVCTDMSLWGHWTSP